MCSSLLHFLLSSRVKRHPSRKKRSLLISPLQILTSSRASLTAEVLQEEDGTPPASPPVLAQNNTTVAVTVDEYEPVAHWNTGRLISREGEPFEVPEADALRFDLEAIAHLAQTVLGRYIGNTL